MHTKRKVLFIITKATQGGAQKYLRDIATSLPRETYEPVLLYGTGGKLAQDIAAAGIATRQLPSLGRDIALISDIRSFFGMVSVIRHVRPDIVHLNSSKAAGLGALAARILGVPKIIFTVHGWPFKEDRIAVARAIIYCVSWVTSLLSHEIIVVSKGDEERGKRMWLMGHKIHYIPLGTDIPKCLSREDASAELSIRTSAPRIVTVAELTKNKGIKYALEAVAELKKRGTTVSYFIIGDGEEKKHLVTSANRLGVIDQIRFLGFVSDAARYLNAFDVFLLPSVKEGMPYVLLEAAAAGLPIVATDIVKAELTNVPSAHIVPPASGSALASAILEALKKSVNKQVATSLPSRAQMLEKTTALYT